LAATTLRNNLGLHTLQEVLQEKEKIAHNMQEHLDSATHQWYLFEKIFSHVSQLDFNLR
jgi:regulator of protease activity HflC (stomatin/prohibitin superfamily)